MRRRTLASRLRCLAALALAAASFGCSSGPTPCMGPGACSATEECLANRCAERGSDPVARAGERRVLMPIELALISQRGPEQTLPAAVTFGSAAFGRTALYLRFTLGARPRHPVESAFLLLEPLPGSAQDARDVAVEAWRIEDSWSRSALRWSSQPGLGLPKADGIARSSAQQPLRIDVTELVRYLEARERQGKAHGIALTASGGDGHGVTFATGAGGGKGPRLELYLASR